MAIEIKTLDEIKKMRKAGILVGQTLERLREVIRPGLMTKDLDLIAHNFITKNVVLHHFSAITDFQQLFVLL